MTTVPERGWAGKTNGELLKLASGLFDVFITADQGLEYQQNLAKAEIIVIVLLAPTNRFHDLEPLMPRILEVLSEARPGTVTRVGT